MKLDGKVAEQKAKRRRVLPLDFVHESTGTIVEFDEMQHFTSFRRHSLELYPEGVSTGFDLDRYIVICHDWSTRADNYRAAKAATGFGPGGRQKQRAYFDDLRDLAVPAMGGPGVIRVACFDNDGRAAYAREREKLQKLMTV
ncbi:DUF7255 family protein [Arthrobacter ginkgonis]|uniref:DUF7255 family protein n=1 Tax=Arthrobacter ginkgonis TaxID=1630594 RepID=UPI0031EE1DA6